MNFILGKDDEFEDEPEDELASAGMHVVENDEEDEDAKAAAAVVDEDEVVEVVEEDEEEEEKKETEEDEAPPDGLKELEELEKVVLTPITFGGDDDE